MEIAKGFPKRRVFQYKRVFLLPDLSASVLRSDKYMERKEGKKRRKELHPNI